MAKKGKQRKPTFKEIVEKAKSDRQSLKPYDIAMTQSARDVYLKLEEESLRAEAAGDSTNQHCKTFRMIDEAIRRLIPADPANPKYALHEPLADMYRIAKGRFRIVWVVDPEQRAILIIFISDSESLRKDGDVRDPYVILNAMARAGHLKGIIEDWRRALEVPPDAPIH